MSADRKRVLLVAATTGYQTREFAAAAERVGADAALATDRCKHMDDPWGDHAVPVRFHDLEASVQALCREAERQCFHGVSAVGDGPALVAAAAAERLGLRYHSLEAARVCHSKLLLRERFREAGLLVPDYYALPLNTDLEEAAAGAHYPCVLKPLRLSASRGVIRANNPAQFAAAFQRIRCILESPEIKRRKEEQDRLIQVETYIPGREFALEGLVTDGRLQTLALFDKPDPLEGPFFEETLYVTPSREPENVQRALLATAEEAVRAVGLTHGPVHAEMRLNEDGVWMLEVAARPIGGLCARAVRFAGGWTLEEAILRHALGEDLSTLRPAEGGSGVLMIPVPRGGVYTGVSGVDEARGVPGIEDVVVTAKEGYRVQPWPEGSSYLGFVFARRATPQETETALREAHGRLNFEILENLPVMRPTSPAGGRSQAEGPSPHQRSIVPSA